MKIKVGDTIRCTRYHDEWVVLNINQDEANDLYVRCLKPGENARCKVGDLTKFSSLYHYWEVLPGKSLNFNNLYDKLNEVQEG